MILHAISMVAVFVDQATQAPIVLQCAPASPDPWWKWIIQSAIPVAGGTLIAVWSFVRNRQSEHEQWIRNQNAGHEQWVRDQCKAEWKELFSRIANIEHEIPVIVTGIPTHEDLESIVLDVLPLLRSTIFIYPTLESNGLIAKWQSYVKYVSGKFQSITQTNRSVQTGTLGDPVSGEDMVRWLDLSTKEEIEVRDRFHTFMAKLRDLAHKSLEMKVGQP